MTCHGGHAFRACRPREIAERRSSRHRLRAQAFFLLAQLRCQRLAEILSRHRPGGSRSRSRSSNGARAIQLDRLVERAWPRASRSRPTRSPVKSERAAHDARALAIRAYATRAPLLVGCRPSPACIRPALTSLRVEPAHRSEHSSVVGRTPASVSLVRLHDHHELHRPAPLSLCRSQHRRSVERRWSLCATDTVMEIISEVIDAYLALVIDRLIGERPEI
jgi:hypothetical protein